MATNYENALNKYSNAHGEDAAKAIDDALADWKRRVQAKVSEINDNTDKGLLKAAIFCEGKAKQLAMERIYNVTIPLDKNGKPMWKRTGLYKATIGSGLNPNAPHSSLIYVGAPYARALEFGTSKGIRGKYIMSDAVLKNQTEIIKIISNYIAGGNKNG